MLHMDSWASLAARRHYFTTPHGGAFQMKEGKANTSHAVKKKLSGEGRF